MSCARSARITVRLSAETLRALRVCAKARKVSASDVVRDLVEAHLNPRQANVTAHDLSRAWVGAINDARITPGARIREALADWAPERR